VYLRLLTCTCNRTGERFHTRMMREHVQCGVQAKRQSLSRFEKTATVIPNDFRLRLHKLTWSAGIARDFHSMPRDLKRNEKVFTEQSSQNRWSNCDYYFIIAESSSASLISFDTRVTLKLLHERIRKKSELLRLPRSEWNLDYVAATY